MTRTKESMKKRRRRRRRPLDRLHPPPAWAFAVALLPAAALSLEARAIFLDPTRKLGPEIRDQVRDLNYNAFDLRAGLSLLF